MAFFLRVHVIELVGSIVRVGWLGVMVSRIVMIQRCCHWPMLALNNYICMVCIKFLVHRCFFFPLFIVYCLSCWRAILIVLRSFFPLSWKIVQTLKPHFSFDVKRNGVGSGSKFP